MKQLLLAFSLFVLGLSASAQGTLNGKNVTSSLLLGADGLKLPVATGRFEILFGDVVLNPLEKTLATAGIFSAGVLTVPGVPAGGTAAITVRAWDTGAGATFALAQAAGFGFASSTFNVVGLGGGLVTPPPLDNFKGLQLSAPPNVASGMFNGKNTASSPLLAANGLNLAVATGRFEILFGDVVLNPLEKTLATAGIFSAGVLTVPGVPVGGTAAITVRAWDTGAGATFAAAQAAGFGFASSTFNVVGLGGGLVTPPALDNFKGLRLASPPTVTFGMFNGKNTTGSPLLAANGLNLPVSVGRVEILFGDLVLNPLEKTLATDGIFSVGVLTVPGAPVGGTVAITVRAWTTSAGATYALAKAAGFGFATATFNVVGLGGGLVTPPALDNFKGLRLSSPNVPPVAVAQSVTTAEDLPLPIKLTGTDAENAALTYTVVALPTKGALSGTGANRTYTPGANLNGADSFTFKVNDGSLDSAVATVTINVTPVNDAPVAVAQSVTTAEDVPLPIKLAGTDVENSPLTFVVVTQPAKGILSGTGANRTYTPNANANGADSFTFKVNDGGLDSAAVTVGINITPVNDTPVATGQSVTTAEDIAVVIKLAGTDVESSPLTFIVVTQPAKGILTGTGAERTYKPGANFSGADSFTFRVNDGSADSAVATVALNVTPVNDAPVATGQSVTTKENVAVAITLAGTDAENSPLTYTVVTPPAKGLLSGSGPGRTYVPNPGFTGPDSFTFRVSDGTANSEVVTVSILVTPADDGPPKETRLSLRLVPEITVEGPVGAVRIVEWSEHVGPDAVWTVLTKVTVGTPGATVVDLAVGSETRFYRAVAEPLVAGQ